MKKRYRKIFYATIVFAGMILMTWQVIIYRNTIISLKIPLGITLIIGLITFVIDYKNYVNTYKDKYGEISLIFYAFMQSILGFGFIIASIFVLTNYYLADENSIEKEYRIIHRSSLSGSKHHRDERKPTFYINYKGMEKELVFPHEYFQNMNTYKSVVLEINKGYFGFEILKSKRLK